MSQATERVKNRFNNRQQDEVKETPGAAKQARDAGPHGKIKHRDGSTQASPSKHKPTSGGSGA